MPTMSMPPLTASLILLAGIDGIAGTDSHSNASMQSFFQFLLITITSNQLVEFVRLDKYYKHL